MMFDQSRSGSAYLSPCREASKPSFVHASCKTSARYLAGVVLMTARRADESRTTTWEAMQRRLKRSGTSGLLGSLLLVYATGRSSGRKSSLRVQYDRSFEVEEETGNGNSKY